MYNMIYCGGQISGI